MAAQRFGEFLLEERIVSRRDLATALERQQASGIPIGEMAVASGFMQKSEVDKVLRAQSRRARRFGEISVEMGLLDEAKVGFLLRAQALERRRIGRVLVESDVLKPNQLRTALKGFRERAVARPRVLFVKGESSGPEAFADLGEARDLEFEFADGVVGFMSACEERRPSLVVMDGDVTPEEEEALVGHARSTPGLRSVAMAVLVSPASERRAGARRYHADFILSPKDAVEKLRRVIERTTGRRKIAEGHVLVVDGDRIRRALAAQDLIDSGYAVTRAESLAEAAGLASALFVDVAAVFVDDMSVTPAEAARTLARDGRGRRMGLVFVTEHAADDRVFGARGGVVTLRPPFSPGRLSEAVRTLVGGEPELGPAVVLVADDNDAVCQILMFSLARRGHKVMCFSNGVDLIEYAHENEPADLVVLDNDLGLISGADVCRELRKISAYEHVPLILLTAAHDKSSVLEGLASGACDYVFKPFDEEELHARLMAHLRVKREIDRLKADRKLLEELSVTDSLTGLFNRRYFFHTLFTEFHRSRRYGRPLSLAIVDIDDFKHVNDTYGHTHGDMVLRETARILRGSCRQSDVVARSGGEEFSVVLPETDRRGAAILAEKVRATIEDAVFCRQDYADLVTVSVGVATFEGDNYAGPQELIEAADRALYAAKNAGKNRVRTAAPDVESAERPKTASRRRPGRGAS